MKNSCNIFVVDDSPAILDSVDLMLDFSGFSVTKFLQGSDMLKVLMNEKKPDLILMDMWLSGEDGRDICKEIKSNPKVSDIPVIIMSASRGLSESALQAGAQAFISKPFDMEEMIETINLYIKPVYD